jgi:HEPN domain-containing protein
MTPADRARPLFEKAGEDIHVLTVLRDDLATTDAVWGFHAQQSVEKLMKALLASQGVRFPFTHRLLELAQLMNKGRHPLPGQFDPLLNLTPYAAEFRYADITSKRAEPPLDRVPTLELIEAMRKWIYSTIGF